MKVIVNDQQSEMMGVTPLNNSISTPTSETPVIDQATNAPTNKPSYLQEQVAFAAQEQVVTNQYEARAIDVANIEPSTLEVWTAAFEETNILSAYVASTPMPDVPDVEGYSPFTKDDSGKSDIDGYEEYAGSFSDSFNPQTTASIKANINREKKNQVILNNGGALGVAASVAAGISDPINMAMMLLPGYGQASMLKTVGQTMAIGATAVTAQEVILHSVQETRTLEESMINIAAGAVFDGIIGGLVHKLTKVEAVSIKKQIVEQLSGSPRSIGAAEVASRGGSVGKEVMETNNPLTMAILGLTRMSPIGRTLQSDSAIVRGTAQDMIDHNFRLSDDAVNATSVESLINLDYAKVGIAEQKAAQAEAKFVKDGGTVDEFNFQVSDAMRNGDVSENVHVQAAVNDLRKEYDAILKRSSDAEIEGTFTLDVDDNPVPIKTTTAASYLTRRKDINAIRQDPKGYQQAWIDGLKEREVRYEAAAIEEGLPVPTKKTDAEWEVIGREIYNRDINLTAGEIQFNMDKTKIPNATKQRVDIKDEYLNDFLVKDWRSLLNGYSKTMIPKARMAERFGTYKLNELEERLLAKLEFESRTTTAAIESGADPVKAQKSLKKIQAKMTAEIKDLTGMAKRLMNEVEIARGNTKWGDLGYSVLRTTRAYNVVSMLGNVLVSSIPDLARQITYSGSLPYLKALAKNLNAKSIKFSGISKDQMGQLSQAIEKTQNIRAREITMVDDQNVTTGFDKRVAQVAQATLKYQGFQHWNSIGKGIAGSLYGDKVARALINGTDKRKMGQLGFTDGMLREMSVQAKLHSTKSGGLYDLNLDLWDIDVHIVEAIEAAAVKESNFIVTTVGKGDLPLLMDGEVAKSLLQFQSFLMAATNRIALPLLQEKSIRAKAEMVTAMLLGYAVTELKSASMGLDTSDHTLKEKAWNAMNHTGLLGYSTELYRRAFSLTAIDPLGVMKNDRKYVSRGKVGAQMGASVSTVNNIIAANPLNTSKTSEQKAKALRRLMPMQNHWLLSKGYNEVEKAIATVMPDKVK